MFGLLWWIIADFTMWVSRRDTELVSRWIVGLGIGLGIVYAIEAGVVKSIGKEVTKRIEGERWKEKLEVAREEEFLDSDTDEIAVGMC